MPLLIIAGMPTSVTRRSRTYSPQVDDWNIQLIPSRDSKRPDLQSCWWDVLERASGDVQGAHVFAYHHREDEYPKFNSGMHDRHRLVWMARSTLGYYGSDMYTKVIEQNLDFECRWRSMLRPRGVDAAGLLPECSFSPRRYGDMWSRMRSVRLDKDDLQRVFMIIQRFRDTHYDGGRWEDNRGLEFRAAPERHGSNTRYGNFKFTYQLPDGFHYNVTGSVASRGFTIEDAEGQLHQFRSYTNIDVHGSIRGGH